MTLAFKNANVLMKRLEAVAKGVTEAGARGLLVAGEHVLGVSNRQAPIEEGDLIRSGAVSQDEASRRTAISYDTDYAVRQHEDMTLRHDDGRNAKFLENAMNAERETAAQIIATAMKGAIG